MDALSRWATLQFGVLVRVLALGQFRENRLVRGCGPVLIEMNYAKRV